MNIKCIFKVISILNCLLLQSQIYATENNTIKLKSVAGTDDGWTPQNIEYITMSGNVELDKGLINRTNNTKQYPALQINGLNLEFDRESQINICEYNKLVLNDCHFQINGNINCIGNIELELNNSTIELNNSQDNINLLENYITNIELNHSVLAFNNITDYKAITLFGNNESAPKIVLNENSNLSFNNNVAMNLNNKGQLILNGVSFLGCNNSKLNLGDGNFTVNEKSKCNLINNAQIISNTAQIKFNDNSILECTNSNLDINNGIIGIKDSMFILENSQCNLGESNFNIDNNGKCFLSKSSNMTSQLAKINLTNSSQLKCTNSSIEIKEGKLSIKGSEFALDNSQLNIGNEKAFDVGLLHIKVTNSGKNSSNFGLYNNSIMESKSGKNSSDFELYDNSIMESKDENCLFKISSGNQFIVDNSDVYVRGTIAQIGNDATDKMLILKNAQFIWNTLAYNPKIVLVEDNPDKPETFIGGVTFVLDDLND